MAQKGKISEVVIGCAHDVSRELGPGFLEAVYENALALELEENGISFVRQAPLDVFYKRTLVGQYQADIVVEDTLILELKAVSAFNATHKAQMMNYLRASGIHVGLLLNFGMSPLGIKRIVWEYSEKDNI